MFRKKESDINVAEDAARFKKYNSRPRRCTLANISATTEQAWEIPKRSPSRRKSVITTSEFGGVEDYKTDDRDNFDFQFADELRRQRSKSVSCLNVGIALRRASGSVGNLLKMQKDKEEGDTTSGRKVSIQHVEDGAKTGGEAILEQAMNGPLSLGDITWKMQVKGIQDGVFCFEIPLDDVENKDITLRVYRGRLLFMTKCAFGETVFPIPRGFVKLPDFVDLKTLDFVLTHDELTLVIRGMVKGSQVGRRLTDSVLPGLMKRVNKSWFKKIFGNRKKSIETSVVRIGSFN